MAEIEVKKIATRKRPTTDFRHKPEEREGYMVERILPRLPSYNYDKYLERGFIPITDPKEPRMDRITCQVCGRVFWGGREYEQHTCTVEKAEEVNPLVCDVCQKECKSELGLSAHKRTHKSKKEE